MNGINLFSYGTLQQREVQLSNYGRLLDGSRDRLTGYRLAKVAISDPAVVATSGSSEHNILHFTGSDEDAVDGTLYHISAEELAASDAYEVDAYRRVEVVLASGRNAFVYVAVDPQAECSGSGDQDEGADALQS